MTTSLPTTAADGSRRVDPANGFAVSNFAAGIAGPVDVEVGADGSLYYLSQTRDGFGLGLPRELLGRPSHPHGQGTTVAPGEAATFAVTQPGWPHWLISGSATVSTSPVPPPTYTLADLLADDGAQFRCVVSNAGGSVSASATLR